MRQHVTKNLSVLFFAFLRFSRFQGIISYLEENVAAALRLPPSTIIVGGKPRQ